MLKYSFGRVQDARLKIDGRGDRTFRRELVAYLRRELPAKPGGPPIIQDLKFVDSCRALPRSAHPRARSIEHFGGSGGNYKY